ncbi:MAG TPA: ATP-binding protein [Candidatus Dormibacteraeota bacterium]|nr:ATP-binding protein [Candidatus Dormibacteraeota bacterium]
MTPEDNRLSRLAQTPAEVAPLAPDRLYRPADLTGLDFTTTADLEPLTGLVGQERARDAVSFGARSPGRGFNVFAIGSSAARVQQSVRAMLEESKAHRPPPLDWVYVNTFAVPHRPTALSLPTGRAPVFQSAMRELIDDLKTAVPAVFEGEEYQARHAAIEASVSGTAEHAFNALGEKAATKGAAILRTPMGFAVAPAKDGEVVSHEEFNAWPEEKRREVRSAVEELEKELEQTLRSIPRLDKERRDAIRALDREMAQFAIAHLIDEAKARFTDLPTILQHLETVRGDLVDNIHLFIADGAEENAPAGVRGRGGPFDRYEVNVLVTRPEGEANAHIVEELHPTLGNLVGRIEYLSQQGVLVTNFLLIKAGALHRANGGVILIDARSLLSEPFSWTALKRALVRREIVIEDVARFVGLTTTVSLEPDPIPLDVKVVLVGDRVLYYLIAALDPELGQHFKVLADFDDEIDRTPASEVLMARSIAAVAAREKVKPLERSAVARIIEHAARLAEDASKITLLVELIHDLTVEAGHWAAEAGHDAVTRADVEQAIRQQIRRASRVQDRSKEMMLRDVALVDTAGSRVGQVNGLSVVSLGTYAFGYPSRITCRVHPGAGKIIDIEREVELGGPLHSKGVLILSGFLAGRYALDTLLSLHASLVFEQSYGGVEGDSASSAELYALLSALADLPLRQDLAVTGSVNQHGVIQAIGGVNEKIEGFFDICAARGLTGTQGIIIPAANVQHLMLREDVVEACASGRFAIYPVTTIDQGVELLTGRPAGSRDAAGEYAAGSVNRLVEGRLKEFAKARYAAERRGERVEEI